MTGVTRSLQAIKTVGEKLGAREFASLAGVPYTTARHWAKLGWQPKGLQALERFAAVAEGHPAAELSNDGDAG